MKNRCAWLFCGVVALLLALQFAVFVNAERFTTTDASEESLSGVIEKTNVSLLNEEPKKREIRCFDVNEDGLIAIGTRSSFPCGYCIAVYTSNGEFLYGYSLFSYAEFELYWSGDDLVICLVRESCTITVDSNGKVLGIKEISETSDNRDIWNELRDPVRSVNGYTYRLQKDMGPLGFFVNEYGRLVITTPDDEEHIFYDVNTEHTLKVVAIVLVGGAFVCLVIGGLAYRIVKFDKKQKKEQADKANQSPLPKI